ncbi:ADFb like protein [Tribolium castaneum]|uniref:ADFb like protein n=2 Tax=Tribolium castaneum TaxID=7070 RepID=D6WQN1_TRICA|nr:PREDICTED: uncharacterized protein LOC103313693 [Tribolium castaneum]EFA07533.2 ADFb like protein [Tribolium castaneum]|eukprot:XP_008195862.2 PREDICTED: uncharacterized protein LOC103313693 [Tribolium castaneum]
MNPTVVRFVVVLAVVAAASAGNEVFPAHPLLPARALVAAPFARLLVPAGSGLEGQYIPDHTEKLYDDGSYKPELTPIPLSASPLGLVPAGSGLEGQYVPDLTEKLYDDGSYKPGLYA